MAVAANRYTTTEFLLPDIRRHGHLPPSQTPFQDADLLAIADGELRASLLPQIKSTRENYYLTSSTLATNTSNTYDIPYRAIGMALQDVWIVNGTQIYPVSRTDTNEQFSTVSSPTGYWSYEMLGNQILIKPVVNVGSIQLWYLQRPNTLVVNSACAQVTGVTQGSGILTFASLPTTFSTGILYDCVQDQPNFNWRFTDQTGTVSGNTVTFSSLPTDVYGNQLIQVGDWLSLAGQTCIPQVPVEFLPLLRQHTIVKYYEIQGYEKKLGPAQKVLEQMRKDLFDLINPRVSSEPKRIVPDSNVIGGYRRWRAWRAT